MPNLLEVATCVGVVERVFNFVYNHFSVLWNELQGELWLLVLYLPSMELHALLALS